MLFQTSMTFVLLRSIKRRYFKECVEHHFPRNYNEWKLDLLSFKRIKKHNEIFQKWGVEYTLGYENTISVF